MSLIVEYANDGKGKERSHEVYVELDNNSVYSLGENAESALYNLLQNMKRIKEEADRIIKLLESGDIYFIDKYTVGKTVNSFYTTDYYTGDKTVHTKEEVMQKFKDMIEPKKDNTSETESSLIGKPVRVMQPGRFITGSIVSYNQDTNTANVEVGSFILVSGPDSKSGIIITVPMNDIQLI